MLEEREGFAEKTIQKLEEKHDVVEKYLCKFNLEFHGFPEKEEENDSEIILELVKVINADIQEEDINIYHCLYKNN